jgi:hypothetical protein
MPGQFPRGRIVWHELITTDAKAAAAFYTKVIGWGTQAGKNLPFYTMWLAGKTPVGGMVPLTEEERRMHMTPHWLPYIATPDADTTTRTAVEMGAKVMTGPIDMPAVGRFTVLQDPQGALFAPFRPVSESAGPDTVRLGDFSWHELATSDPRNAWTFYETLFGWKKTSAMDMGPAGTYQMFSWGGAGAGGIYTKSAALVMTPSHWLSYVRVPNADKTAALAQSLGAKLTNPVMDIPGGDRIAMLQDPQGALFAAHAFAAKNARAKPAKKKGKPARKAAKKARPMKKTAQRGKKAKQR